MRKFGLINSVEEPKLIQCYTNLLKLCMRTPKPKAKTPIHLLREKITLYLHCSLILWKPTAGAMLRVVNNNADLEPG